MKRSPIRKSAKRIKAGKKVTEWQSIRKELDKELSHITSCELKLPGCTRKIVNYAHAVKRRKLRKDATIGSPEHIKTCVLSCMFCHNRIEYLSAADMQRIVMTAYSERNTYGI